MESIARWIKLSFAAIGSALAYFLGGLDGFLYALIVMVSVDYITGVVAAIETKTLSSEAGFRGILHKVVIFALVGIGHTLDVYVVKQGGVIRTAVIFYYIANEGISILENCAEIGLPVPKKLKDVLLQLKEKDDEENGSIDP